MALKNQKALILAEDFYEDLELWYPYYRLGEEGAAVEIVGPKAEQEYKSKHGYPVVTNAAAKDRRGDQCDILIVPGGYAPDKMRRNADMVRLVREAFLAGRVVAAICHGPWLLAEADILRGKKVTSVSAIKTDLINAGASYFDEEVVVDGNLITSRTPADLPAFCRAIIRAAAK